MVSDGHLRRRLGMKIRAVIAGLIMRWLLGYYSCRGIIRYSVNFSPTLLTALVVTQMVTLKNDVTARPPCPLRMPARDTVSCRGVLWER